MIRPIIGDSSPWLRRTRRTPARTKAGPPTPIRAALSYGRGKCRKRAPTCWSIRARGAAGEIGPEEARLRNRNTVPSPLDCPRPAAVRSPATPANLDIDRSDSSPRVRSPRSVTCESAMPVHAVMAGVGKRYYSRRERQGSSGDRCPDGRSRTPDEGGPTACTGSHERDAARRATAASRPVTATWPHARQLHRPPSLAGSRLATGTKVPLCSVATAPTMTP